MRQKIYIYIFALIFVIGLKADILIARPDKADEKIAVSARIADSSVPLNRILPFSITLEWQGPSDRYSISSLENPSVTNFTIISSSASNSVEFRDGGQYTVKIYEFGLKPVELGMGYIESIILEYREGDSEESKREMTQRLAVRIIEPVPEQEEKGKWIYGIAGLLAVVSVFSVFFYRRRVKSGSDLHPDETAKLSLEERYLQKLKEAHSDVSDFREGLGILTRQLSGFLAEKFGLVSASFSGEELFRSLLEKGVDDKEAEMIREILDKSDILKFSGQPVDRGTYEMVYSDLTGVIERMRDKDVTPAGDSENQNKST